jgi:hypothetical protein
MRYVHIATGPAEIKHGRHHLLNAFGGHSATQIPICHSASGLHTAIGYACSFFDFDRHALMVSHSNILLPLGKSLFLSC